MEPRTLIVTGLAIALVLPVGPSIASSLEPSQEDPTTPPGDLAPAPRTAPGLLEGLGPVNPVLVQFDSLALRDSIESTLDAHVLYRFQGLPALALEAPPDTVHKLSRTPGVAYVERADHPIAFDLETATLATKAREVWDPTADNPRLPGDPEPIEVNDTTVDGRGVGIAIVDSGIETTHPDFRAENKVQRSFVATAQGVVEAPFFSPQNPHGTAVAGVAAGSATASGGELAGAAPGASLYSFAIEHTHLDQGAIQTERVTLYPAVALDWILAHGADQDPPIRVVNNAWHCRTLDCRESVSEETIFGELAERLTENGTVVTWAYGNGESSWNPEATLPVGGVLGVAATNDRNLGLRNGCSAGVSSEGNPLDPSTWPDVAAPGASIETTTPLNVRYDLLARGTAGRVPIVGSQYSNFTGTSLSAGHAAGVAALTLQANPGLSPAEVEWILEDTATIPQSETCDQPSNRGDPTHPTHPANHKVGHGLLDAHEAVQTAIGFEGIPETNATAETPDESFLEAQNRKETDTVAVEDRLYLTEDRGFTKTRPSGEQPVTLQGSSNEPVAFTTDPFDAPRSISGIDASLWLSVDTEAITNWDVLADIDILVKVQEIGPDGALQNGVTTEARFAITPPNQPRERPIVQPLSDPLDLEAGDRLRLVLNVTEGGAGGDGTEFTSWELRLGSWEHPSHLGIGQRAPDPSGTDTYRGCRERADVRSDACTWVDADHPSASFGPDGGRYALVWEGPGGSGAEMVEDGVPRESCTIPSDVDWGKCHVRTHSDWPSGPDVCRAIADSPPIQGHGRCQLVFRG